MANGALSFDANSLQTFDRTTRVGIITDNIDYASIPTKNLSIFPLAHSNASAIPFHNYPSKAITVTGTIVGSSESDLDSRLDSFRGFLRGTNKNLDINTNGSTRRYIATVNALTITVSENKKYATFQIEFICTIPFGVDTTPTTALNGTGRTAAAYSDAYTFLGTAPSQLPIVTITLTAVSSTGSQQLFWGNQDTGQSITLTRSNWAAGDVIVIDCGAKTVTVNGVVADFVGAFPEFVPGSRTMVYGDSFTSRTMTENVVYNVRYL